jgi:hypothetical protein
VVFVGGTTVLIVALGFDAPAAPLVLLCAPVLDVAARRGWGQGVTALALTAATMFAVVPLRQRFNDLGLDAGDAIVALPLTWVAVLIALVMISGRVPKPGRGTRTAGSAVAALLLLASTAGAHDPGQGQPAGNVSWHVQVDGATVSVSASADALCAGGSARFVARRGGAVVVGRATRSACGRKDTLRLPRPGRWFVYLEATDNGHPLESWIPVKAASRASIVDASRYAYRPSASGASAVKWIAGTALYAAIAAFVITLARVARQRR